jgi:hypothetical protein
MAGVEAPLMVAWRACRRDEGGGEQQGARLGDHGGVQGVGSSVLVSLLCCSLPEAAVREEGSRNEGGRRREEKKEGKEKKRKKRKKYRKISKF